MSDSVQYAAQAVFWVALMAGVGWALRPLINRIDNREDGPK